MSDQQSDGVLVRNCFTKSYAHRHDALRTRLESALEAADDVGELENHHNTALYICKVLGDYYTVFEDQDFKEFADKYCTRKPKVQRNAAGPKYTYFTWAFLCIIAAILVKLIDAVEGGGSFHWLISVLLGGLALRFSYDGWRSLR